MEENKVLKPAKEIEDKDQKGILPADPKEEVILPQPSRLSDSPKKQTEIKELKVNEGLVTPSVAPSIFVQKDDEITPTATKYSPTTTTTTTTTTSSTTTSTTTSSTTTSTTTSSTTTSTTTTTTNSRKPFTDRDPLKGYLTVFPSLPSGAADSPFQNDECKVLNTAIVADVVNCTQPFIQSVYNSYQQADIAAVDVIDCICSTSFKVGHQDLDVHIRNSCPPPGNMTKSGFFSIKDGCGVIPYDYRSISDSLSVFARIMNGESYIPFSKSLGVKNQGLIAAIVSLVLFMM